MNTIIVPALAITFAGFLLVVAMGPPATRARRPAPPPRRIGSAALCRIDRAYADAWRWN